jgi:hypothetical protein
MSSMKKIFHEDVVVYLSPFAFPPSPAFPLVLPERLQPYRRPDRRNQQQ